jgi:beta-lysine N6-acetyltransferase
LVKVKKTKKKVMETSGNTTFVTRENLSELRIDDNIANNVELMSDEWTSLNPSDKNMGVVKFHLDKGVSTTVVGTVYGLDFEINVKGCKVNVFFDYYNKRLKIFDYKVTDFSALTKRLVWLAKHNKFDKIFVKARKRDFQRFLSHGFVMEGILRYYFNGEDAYVLSRFSSKSRAISKNLLSESELIEDLIYNTEKREAKKLDSDIKIITATTEHIPQLTFIYKSVFETYPSPLTNPDYISSTMDRNVVYKVAVQKGEAIAAASVEINKKHSNAEMTDCATTPKARNKGLMQHILMSLEEDLRGMDIKTAYTLARSKSMGMNKVFFRLGYEYSGRLINNCDIFGNYEDMNIWVKKL